MAAADTSSVFIVANAVRRGTAKTRNEKEHGVIATIAERIAAGIPLCLAAGLAKISSLPHLHHLLRSARLAHP